MPSYVRLPNRSVRMERCMDKSKCCYGIEWVLSDEGYFENYAHYNPRWREEAVRKQGLSGLYTRDSGEYRFQRGEDLVGQVFLQQTSVFVEDLQNISQDSALADMIRGSVEFSRADLAKTYDIHSAAFFPAGKGVIEIGSTQRLACRADLIADEILDQLLVDDREEDDVGARCLKAERANSGEDSADLFAVLPATCGSLRLQRLVEGSPACYGIEWVFCDDGSLQHRSHYNPPWRVEGVRRQGLKGLYTTGSEHYKFSPGEGAVGKAFTEQKPIFIEDLQNHLQEAVHNAISGESIHFLRCKLAKEYDIRSAIFLPLPEGVIEIGSTQQFHNAEDFLTQKLLKSVRMML
mmetsp:Transcript_29302/g.51284  ORF Transcript_29302/g.51284 Transcript_29302/m.51284 type:complete len:349 (-) Transcript_29302:265-1311(-)